MPSASPQTAQEATPAERPDPAVLVLSEAWPCPFTAIDGMKKNAGFDGAVSNTVPDWVRAGVREVAELVPPPAVAVAARSTVTAGVDPDVVRRPQRNVAIRIPPDHRLEQAVVERVDPGAWRSERRDVQGRSGRRDRHP